MSNVNPNFGQPAPQSDIVEFPCPGCQRMLKVPSKHVGAKARCPSCQQVATVPSPPSAPAPATAPLPNSSFQPEPTPQFPAPQNPVATPAPQFNPVAPTPAPANPYADPAPNPYGQPAQPYGQQPAQPYGQPAQPYNQPYNPYQTPAANASPFGGVDYRCKQHPEVGAVARCKICFTPVCQTCRFDFSGGMAICPGCATNKSVSMPSARQSILAFAYLCAILGTLCTGMLVSGAVMDEIGILAFGFGMTAAAIIGFGLSIAAVDGRLGNSVPIWAALIWNSIIFVGVMALILLGLSMGAM